MLTNGLVVSCILFFAAWWGDASINLKLDFLNFNFDGHNDQARLANVTEQNKEHAKALYYSQFGIGWPLKAMFFSILAIPYYLLIFLLHLAYIKFKKKQQTQAQYHCQLIA